MSVSAGKTQINTSLDAIIFLPCENFAINKKDAGSPPPAFAGAGSAGMTAFCHKARKPQYSALLRIARGDGLCRRQACFHPSFNAAAIPIDLRVSGGDGPQGGVVGQPALGTGAEKHGGGRCERVDAGSAAQSEKLLLRHDPIERRGDWEGAGRVGPAGIGGEHGGDLQRRSRGDVRRPRAVVQGQLYVRRGGQNAIGDPSAGAGEAGNGYQHIQRKR